MKPKYYPITQIDPEVGDLVRSIYWVNCFYGKVVRVRYHKGKKVGAWVEYWESGRRIEKGFHDNPLYHGQGVGKEDWRKIKTMYEFEWREKMETSSWVYDTYYRHIEYFYEYIV